MTDYLIISDVSADIPMELVTEYDIHFVPMTYTTGEEEHVCNTLETEENMHLFYEAQRNGVPTQTSQITPNAYVEYFSTFLKEGKDIIYLSLSSGLSNTYNSALLAQRELSEEYEDAHLYVVDSLGATGGMGLLLELAAKNRLNGMSVKDNADWMSANAIKLAHWFMVEDLMYLKRGGRISAASAIVGTTLNIKPVLEIDENGKLITIAKKRGSKLALKYLVDQYFDTRDESFEKIVYITHGDAKDAAESVKQMILERDPEVIVRTRVLCPIIGSHTGPGMVAVLHMGARQ